MSPHEGWDAWRKHILLELERMNTAHEKQVDKIDSLIEHNATVKSDIASLKVKAGLWGAVAGFIPAFVSLIYFLIKRGN